MNICLACEYDEPRDDCACHGDEGYLPAECLWDDPIAIAA